MIVCPACQAENPDGTKICVKCATELPKNAKGAQKAAVAAAPAKGMDPNDFRRNLFDVFWFLLIIGIIIVGFIVIAGKTKGGLSEVDEAKIIETPKVVAVAPKPSRRPGARRRLEQVEEEPAVEFGNPETFYEKGKTQYDAHKYQASFNSLKKALEVDPAFAKAYFAMGYLYARFDMDDAAVRMYEMALRFDSHQVDTINNLGMMYYKAGNYDDALGLFQTAVALNDQNADYEYNLGSVYLERNQPQEALHSLQKAASLRPNDVSIMTHLALTYEKLGMKQEAQDSWQKVLQFADSPEALQQAQTHIFFLQSQS